MRFQVQNIEGRRRWVRQPFDDRFKISLNFNGLDYPEGTVIDVLPPGNPTPEQVISNREHLQLVEKYKKQLRKIEQITSINSELIELNAQLLEVLDAVKPGVARAGRVQFERITGTKLPQPVAEHCCST